MISADVIASINGDAITAVLPLGTSFTNLVPSIQYNGTSISPDTGIAQNFTGPFYYNVTAANGATRMYTVTVRYISSLKQILSFSFEKSNNGFFSEDYHGEISNDTIRVNLPASSSIDHLTPTISYVGARISPGEQITDYRNDVTYTVTAEDGSTKQYTVIVLGNTMMFAGSADGNLYALDPATGVLKWKYLTGGGISGAPTASNGTVFFISGDSYLYALDAASGAFKWKFLYSYENVSDPTVANGRVYMSTQGPYGNIGWIYCVDALSGAVIWQQTSFSASSVTVANGSAVISSFYGPVSYDAATGTGNWYFNSGITRDNPAYHNGNIYVGAELGLHCLDITTGNPKWVHTGIYVNGSPTIVNGTIYAGEGSGGYLYAFEEATGNTKWRFQCYGSAYGGGGNFSAPLFCKGVVVAGCDDTVLYGVDAATGTRIWTFGNTTQLGYGAPSVTIANGILFTGSYNNNIYCMNPLTGDIKWIFPTGGTTYGGPCIVDNRGNSYHPGSSGEQN